MPRIASNYLDSPPKNQNKGIGLAHFGSLPNFPRQHGVLLCKPISPNYQSRPKIKTTTYPRYPHNSKDYFPIGKLKLTSQSLTAWKPNPTSHTTAKLSIANSGLFGYKTNLGCSRHDFPPHGSEALTLPIILNQIPLRSRNYYEHYRSPNDLKIFME